MELKNYLARSVADLAGFLVSIILFAKIIEMPVDWVSNILMLIFAIQLIIFFIKMLSNMLNAADIIRTRYIRSARNRRYR